MEQRFQEAVEINRKIFGTPVFQHASGIRGLNGDYWDMMVEARPLDIMHTVDADMVDGLLREIRADPPPLPSLGGRLSETAAMLSRQSEEV